MYEKFFEVKMIYLSNGYPGYSVEFYEADSPDKIIIAPISDIESEEIMMQNFSDLLDISKIENNKYIYFIKNDKKGGAISSDRKLMVKEDVIDI